LGVAPRGKRGGLAQAGRSVTDDLEDGMAALYDLFQKAPELGSLIDPKAATQGDLISAQWDELAAKLDLALAAKEGGADDAQDTEATSAALGGSRHRARHGARLAHPYPALPFGDDQSAVSWVGGSWFGAQRLFAKNITRQPKVKSPMCFLERCLKLCVPLAVWCRL
jgi:hypothetical protein